jgi:hypothetical protein
VGHNEAPVSEVRRTDARSRNNERPDGVAETLQVRSAIVERHADEASNVLSKHPSGPELRHDPAHLRPEETVIRRASSLPGATERLAGKAAGDEGRASDAGVPKRSSCNVADVVESGNPGPVLFQDFSAVSISLYLCDCLEAGLFRSKIDTPDPCEEGEVREVHAIAPGTWSYSTSCVTRTRCVPTVP